MNNKKYSVIILGICVLMMTLIYVPAFAIANIFTSYISEDFGVTRAVFSLHITTLTFSSMISVMFIGKLLEKVPVKKLMIISLVGISICFIAYSAASYMWQFFLISAFTGPFSVALGNITISVIIGDWFPQKLQGKAIGISMAGSGIGAAIFTPIVSAVCNTMSWRIAYLGFAALTLFVMLPAIALGLRTSDSADRMSVSEADDLSGISYNETKKTPAFIICLVVFFAFSFASIIPHSSGYLYFMELGYSAGKSASLMSVAALTLIAGKLLLGSICDWKSARFGTMLFCIIMTASYVLFIAASKYSFLSLFAAALFGVSNSISTVADPLIVREVWGAKDFGRIMGMLYVGYYAGVGIAPVFASYIFDNFGSYTAAYISGLVVTILMEIGLNLVYIARKEPRRLSAQEQT